MRQTNREKEGNTLILDSEKLTACGDAVVITACGTAPPRVPGQAAVPI